MQVKVKITNKGKKTATNIVAGFDFSQGKVSKPGLSTTKNMTMTRMRDVVEIKVAKLEPGETAELMLIGAQGANQATYKVTKVTMDQVDSNPEGDILSDTYTNPPMYNT